MCVTCVTRVSQAWLDSIPPRPFPFYESAHSGGSMVLAPDGKHLYSTNRGHDSIAGFAIGSWPRLVAERCLPSGATTIEPPECGWS